MKVLKLKGFEYIDGDDDKNILKFADEIEVTGKNVSITVSIDDDGALALSSEDGTLMASSSDKDGNTLTVRLTSL